jgi:hypothetical protein
MALTRPLLSQLNTNIIAFSDNMMVINAGNIANRDLGIVFDRSVNSQSNVALFWQESSSSFTFAQTTSSGLNNANIVVGVTSNVVLGNIILAGNGAAGSTAGIFYANGSQWSGGGGGTPGGISGQIQYNNLGAFTGASGATFSGTTLSVTQLNVNTSVTIGTTLGVTGTITGTTINAATIGNTGAVLTGTLQTAAQNNITSVGNITAAGVTSSARIAPSANASVDLGATGLRWNNVYGVTFSGIATTAKYADLAEIYIADEDYPPGTVVVFGGEKEITTTIVAHDTRVAGVISTNPAYLMNSEVQGLPVALTGRVPCLVQGPVKKGDVLVTSITPGTAQRINTVEFQPGCVVGKSLENIPDNELKLIEVVVGRF